jgi:peptidoglycan hydrolase-like protein with peptidoglycan-binding domain
MNRAILVTVSATALALSGCSMFRAEGSSQRSQAPASSQSSQQAAPSTAQSSSTTSRSAAAQPGASSSTTDYDNTASGTSMRMSADEVRQAQQKLKDDGDYTGQVDGKMGPKTAQALKKFQQSNGLPQTGKLDRQTASRLGISMTGSSQPSTSNSSRSGSSATGASSSAPGNKSTTGTGTTGTGSTNQ